MGPGRCSGSSFGPPCAGHVRSLHWRTWFGEEVMRGSDLNRHVFDLQEQHGDFFRSSSSCARPAQRTMGGRFMRIGNLARNAVIAALLFAPATALAADVNVSGLIQFDYYSSDDNNNYTADNTFIWRRARLAASGDIVKD